LIYESPDDEILSQAVRYGKSWQKVRPRLENLQSQRAGARREERNAKTQRKANKVAVKDKIPEFGFWLSFR
jgi:hypothetical protein